MKNNENGFVQGDSSKQGPVENLALLDSIKQMALAMYNREGTI
jgi:hypothetical protein